MSIISAETMLEKLWSIQKQLESALIDHELTVYRLDAASIRAFVPGEIWEIDVCSDGTVNFEVFASTPMQGEAELTTAIAEIRNLDKEQE